MFSFSACKKGTTRNQGFPLDSSPIEPVQWMVTPLQRGVLNSPTHLVIKLILTSKVESSPKRLLDFRGNFLGTGGVQEQGASLLTNIVIHERLGTGYTFRSLTTGESACSPTQCASSTIFLILLSFPANDAAGIRRWWRVCVPS